MESRGLGRKSKARTRKLKLIAMIRSAAKLFMNSPPVCRNYMLIIILSRRSGECKKFKVKYAE
jgi:hypothetical protein